MYVFSAVILGSRVPMVFPVVAYMVDYFVFMNGACF
jgi:hypothetical protein